MKCEQAQSNDSLRNLVPFVQFKKRENTHGDVLLLVSLQASALLCFIKQEF